MSFKPLSFLAARGWFHASIVFPRLLSWFSESKYLFLSPVLYLYIGCAISEKNGHPTDNIILSKTTLWFETEVHSHKTVRIFDSRWRLVVLPNENGRAWKSWLNERGAWTLTSLTKKNTYKIHIKPPDYSSWYKNRLNISFLQYNNVKSVKILSWPFFIIFAGNIILYKELDTFTLNSLLLTLNHFPSVASRGEIIALRRH